MTVIAGMVLSAMVGAAERGGTSTDDLKSSSATLTAIPAADPGVAQPTAWPRNIEILDGLLSGASPFKESARHIAVSAGLADFSKRTLGPYSEIAARIADVVYEAVLPSSRSGTLHWPLLILTLVIGVGLFVIRAGRGARGADGRERKVGLAEYLLPREIYAHPSARVDIGLYLLDRALMPLWLALGVALIAPFVERWTMVAAQDLFGPGPALKATLGWKLAYGFGTLLVADMIFYFTHLFGHRTRIGWAFHKVHHSAAVLTPLTRYREHFVEGILYAAGAAAGLGLCGGAFAYIIRGPIVEITVMNLGIFVFLFAINGNFRHYHVSFRYPRWLERWLQSPGMHHVHHSYLPHHRDKNLGLVTSVWDRLVGTLYIGDPYEETPWGLGPEEQAHYSTFAQNVFGPFRDVYGLFARKDGVSANT
ncbi:MAG: sterol desaturase family protein [Steroidobacteraceae bacterium]|jgi:sterol desaturase/sphingolipid hydroxylase (fatty acid hydroxylase superfamily)